MSVDQITRDLQRENEKLLSRVEIMQDTFRQQVQQIETLKQSRKRHKEANERHQDELSRLQVSYRELFELAEATIAADTHYANNPSAVNMEILERCIAVLRDEVLERDEVAT